MEMIAVSNPERGEDFILASLPALSKNRRQP